MHRPVNCRSTHSTALSTRFSAWQATLLLVRMYCPQRNRKAVILFWRSAVQVPSGLNLTGSLYYTSSRRSPRLHSSYHGYRFGHACTTSAVWENLYDYWLVIHVIPWLKCAWCEWIINSKSKLSSNGGLVFHFLGLEFCACNTIPAVRLSHLCCLRGHRLIHTLRHLTFLLPQLQPHRYCRGRRFLSQAGTETFKSNRWSAAESDQTSTPNPCSLPTRDCALGVNVTRIDHIEIRQNVACLLLLRPGVLSQSMQEVSFWCSAASCQPFVSCGAVTGWYAAWLAGSDRCLEKQTDTTAKFSTSDSVGGRRRDHERPRASDIYRALW